MLTDPHPLVIPPKPKGCVLDPESARLIKEMASVGLAAIDIMRVLGWSAADLHLNRALLPQLDAAIKQGRAEAKFAIMHTVYQKAISGDLKAARLYLSVHAGWNLREHIPLEQFNLDENVFERENVVAAPAEGVEPQQLAEWETALRDDGQPAEAP